VAIVLNRIRERERLSRQRQKPGASRMKRACQQQVISVVASIVALLALAPGAAHAAGWSGWARCVLDIGGPGYQNKETHTWFVSNVTGNTVATQGSGTWSAAGSGSLDEGSPQSTSQHAEWAISAGPINGGRFGVSVNNGMVSIRPYHSQLGQPNGISGYAQQTINYHLRSPSPINATEFEWAFPTVEGPATSQTIIGSGAGIPHPGWGLMRTSTSTMTVSCQWSFANGAIPDPPSPVNPTPAPVALTLPERPWTGSVECDITVTANGYQDRQIHSWTLSGVRPTASGGVFAHRVAWKVKGNGSLKQGVGKQSFSANWRTTVDEKAGISMFIRAPDDMLIIAAWQAPRRVPGGVAGSRATQPISLDAVEWLFPPIVTESGRSSVGGKSTQRVTGWVTPLQPPGATFGSLCTWQLQKN
jgi:hypothetical protein